MARTSSRVRRVVAVGAIAALATLAGCVAAEAGQRCDTVVRGAARSPVVDATVDVDDAGGGRSGPVACRVAIELDDATVVYEDLVFLPESGRAATVEWDATEARLWVQNGVDDPFSVSPRDGGAESATWVAG